MRTLTLAVLSLYQASASYIWAPAMGSWNGAGPFNLTVYRQRSHGLQDWSSIGGETTGALIFMDCYAVAGCAIACESWPMTGRATNPPQAIAGFGRRLGHGGIPCYNMTTYSSVGRRLAHGGASSWSRPVVSWAPDYSAPNNDFCDMRTQVNPLRTQNEALIGLITMAWIANCFVIPRTAVPLVHAKYSGLRGVITILAPAISNMLSMNAQYGLDNVVPDSRLSSHDGRRCDAI